ncbi:MAG: LysR family transcriptional regulator [Deltaproteobacteria bacterium]|nr:LysR family transcriptional regulator [Deltaproteobacteria bacterium]
MNPNQLQTFFHAAQTLNFSQAAERLNVTQPAVSAQIRKLEEDLGVKLFARLGKRLVLTEPGEVLLAHARKIVKLQDEAVQALEQMRLVRRGTLKLGAARTYARNIIPPLLASFQSAYPLVNIVLVEGSSRDVARRLWSLDIEVAVIAAPGRVRRVEFRFFRNEELVPIVSPQHPLAGKEDVPFRAVAAYPIIMREKGSGTRKVVAELYRRYRAKPQTVLETSNADVIRKQVALGKSFSFMTRSVAAPDIQAGSVATFTLKNERPSLAIFTAVLGGHQLSQPARAFLNLLHKDPA